ncbi:MAG: electron transfer flavoprotein subunit beta/FixA family protein [Deltaproteobacteria bacterium]|nr:electron transfer flavoprotein subunit beta/FixA family protein [Deltaproteobacteria bacterium]MBW2318226.1 electron transfer flavoprotein subunit beta/FixA family protein [Deltaproteobacteria bacterium]OEU45439.1 MAG: electron transfer flavoprotein subunit beta [Desulfobacterales bacterium S7086C20]
MEIVVLLKQVPDTEATIQIGDDKTTIKTEDIKWVINPYDEYAVEEALRIKEAQGESKVTILTAGKQRAIEAIRTALAMGADEGVLIDDPAIEKTDSLGIAKILAAALKEIPCDLIIAGQRAVDDDCYMVPAAVAEFVGIPQVSMVVKQEINNGKISCERTVEGGTVVIEAELPALFTTQKGINEPRYASLPGIMKAKKKPLETKSLADIGIDSNEVGKAAAKCVVRNLSFPPERAPGKIIEGETVEEKAVELARLLREEAKVI